MARIFLLGDRSTAFTSVPSAQGGQIPWAGHPIVQVQEAQTSFLFADAPAVNCDPDYVEWYKISYPVEFD